MIDVKIIKLTDQEEVKQLWKQRQQYTPSILHYDADTVFQELCPNSYKLLYLLMNFPLSVACMECISSKLKFAKTRLKNQLSQTTLESLLRITTESPKLWFSDSQYEYFVNELQKTIQKWKWVFEVSVFVSFLDMNSCKWGNFEVFMYEKCGKDNRCLDYFSIDSWYNW